MGRGFAAARGEHGLTAAPSALTSLAALAFSAPRGPRLRRPAEEVPAALPTLALLRLHLRSLRSLPSGWLSKCTLSQTQSLRKRIPLAAGKAPAWQTLRHKQARPTAPSNPSKLS